MRCHGMKRGRDVPLMHHGGTTCKVDKYRVFADSSIRVYGLLNFQA